MRCESAAQGAIGSGGRLDIYDSAKAITAGRRPRRVCAVPEGWCLVASPLVSAPYLGFGVWRLASSGVRFWRPALPALYCTHWSRTCSTHRQLRGAVCAILAICCRRSDESPASEADRPPALAPSALCSQPASPPASLLPARSQLAPRPGPQRAPGLQPPYARHGTAASSAIYCHEGDMHAACCMRTASGLLLSLSVL